MKQITECGYAVINKRLRFCHVQEKPSTDLLFCLLWLRQKRQNVVTLRLWAWVMSWKKIKENYPTSVKILTYRCLFVSPCLSVLPPLSLHLLFLWQLSFPSYNGPRLLWRYRLPLPRPSWRRQNGGVWVRGKSWNLTWLLKSVVFLLRNNCKSNCNLVMLYSDPKVQWVFLFLLES